MNLRIKFAIIGSQTGARLKMNRTSQKQGMMLPQGMAVLLPESAARQRRVERFVLSVLDRWGYQEVVPPLFEYLDVLSRGVGAGIIEKSYKFVDPSNGRVMVLRPDVTAQIARIVAVLMADEPTPIRLCYSAKVFRHEEEHAGREREILQIGSELIGLEDVEADAEIVALAAEVLTGLKLSQFRIAIGHVGFFKGPLQELGVPAREHAAIQEAVAGRDAVRLAQRLKSLALGMAEVRAVTGILELFGQDEVFARARRMVSAVSSRWRGRAANSSLAALERLEAIYRLLGQYGYGGKILVDLSEVRGFDCDLEAVLYVFAEGVGYELGGGGRYDHLIGQFGLDLPSTGFALHMDRLLRALDQAGLGTPPGAGLQSADMVLVDGDGGSGDGIRLSQILRGKGIRVIRKTSGEGTVDSILADCRRMKIDSCVILLQGDRAGRRSGSAGRKALMSREAVWASTSTGVKKRVRLQSLIRQAVKRYARGREQS